MELAKRALLDETCKHTIDYLQHDKVWFVIDTDTWEKEGKIAPLRDFCKTMNSHITEAYNEAKSYEAWNVAQSNPCFEVWLYYHHYADLPNEDDVAAQPSIKAFVDSKIIGGFDYQRDPARIYKAIDNSEKNYRQRIDGYPDRFSTELSKLGRVIMNFVKTEVHKLQNKMG